MEIDSKFIMKVVTLGSLGYSFSRAVNVLDIQEDDMDEFKRQWSDPKSAVVRAYKKGIDQADYAIDIKLYEKARNGDLKALEAFERRKHQRKGN